MHKAKDQLAVEMRANGIETRGEDWDGTYVRLVELPTGVDSTPIYKGLPGDLCQCPHYGYVLSGAITLRYADGTEEVMRAGDLYSWPAGHTGWTDEGVTFLEFSPEAQLRPVLEHIAAQMTVT